MMQAETFLEIRHFGDDCQLRAMWLPNKFLDTCILVISFQLPLLFSIQLKCVMNEMRDPSKLFFLRTLIIFFYDAQNAILTLVCLHRREGR